MANKGQSQNSTQEELWLKQAQNKEFEFHLTNEWRQSDKFIEDTKKLFEYFHFNSERFHNNLVVDLGAGSRLRSKFFQGARIVAIEPLADRFLTQIEWSDLRDAWRLCSIPAEQFVDEVEGTADLIICINVLDHTFDPLAILRNARKYLKPDGQMLLSVDLHDSADEMHPIHLKESLLDELVLQAGFFIRRKYKGLPSSSSYGHGVAYTLILTPLEQLQISKDFLFVCSNSNQVLIFQPIAQELRKAGREPSFISLDQYYAQGASQKLQNMDFPWAELPSSNSNNNWFAMNLQQRQILEMSANRAIEASFLAQLPRCIVVGNDIGVLESSFLSLAKSHQVSTVLVQDGLYWTSSKADIKEHAAQGTQGCDLVCTWGAGISKRLMDLGVSSKVVITGNPRYDLVNDRSTELPLDSEVLNTKIKILVAGQCFAKYGHMSISDEKLMYKRLLSLLANKEDVHIYFKLHPQQDEAYYKPLLEEQIHKITLITSGDSISLLKQMDVLVTINSTVAVEAILCRVPTILMNYLVNIRTPPDFEDYPFLYHDEKQFLHDYMKHEFPKNIGLSDAFFEKFVDLTVHKLDGNAAIRIKNALIYLVDQVNEPEISVLLCSYNRAETLKLCLDALQHQTLDKSQFEVICVNDGSTDHTGVVMQTALKTLPGSYHEHSTNKALAAARNTALRAAKGKYFLFINDDTIAASDMLEQHLAAHQAHYGEKLAVLGDFRLCRS